MTLEAFKSTDNKTDLYQMYVCPFQPHENYLLIGQNKLNQSESV